MLTSIPNDMRDELKAIAAKPDFGSLRAVCEEALTRFLLARPYAESPHFFWLLEPSPKPDDWRAFNVVVPPALQRRVRSEAIRLDVSLRTFLRSALSSFLDGQLDSTDWAR